MFQSIISLLASSIIALSPLPTGDVLAEKSFNLTNRQPDPWVNTVFADNIVLTMRYLDDPGFKRPANEADYARVREPFETKFILKPGETFTYQEDVLPEFRGKVGKTTNARFNFEQGFRSSGWLMGDGVCHLASFINITAQEAGLTVVAPARHDFAAIADIPREFGTSIFYRPGDISNNSHQNLYVTNTLEEDVTFTFHVTQNDIALAISKK